MTGRRWDSLSDALTWTVGRSYVDHACLSPDRMIIIEDLSLTPNAGSGK